MAEDREGKRIGVFICHCGRNIAGGVDIEALLASTNDLERVDYVVDNRFSCSEDGQEEIKQAITEHSLDRVIVPTPLTMFAAIRTGSSSPPAIQACI